MIDFVVKIDVQLMYFLNVALHNPVFDRIMPLFHDDHAWRATLVIVFLVLVVFGGTKGKWTVVGGLMLLALSDPISSQIIKPLVGRIRPCNVLDGIWLFKGGIWLITPEPVIEIYKSSYSFTSSHAANTSGQAIWWGLYYPKIRWYIWSLGIAIGYSRVYDGVHYPVDVFFGWVIGALCFAIIWSASQRWGPKALKTSLIQS